LSKQERHNQQQAKQKVSVPNELPIKKNGERRALVIGISKYDHNNKFSYLDFCENDANAVYTILKAQGYDIGENAKLVGRVEWARMRDAIIDFFTDRGIKSEDTLFFYFSGHGYLDKNTGRTYLSTSEIDPGWPERRGITFEELTTYLNYSNSERIIAVLDCCYSGALEITGGKGGEEEQDESSAKAEKGEQIASLAEANMKRTLDRLIKSGQGRCVLASSLEEQKSFKMEGQQYSTFTYFLVQGLKGAEGESVDDNGYVTPELLGSYINKKMEELPKIKQKPIRKIEVTGLLILAYYPNLAKAQQQQPQISQKSYLLELLAEGKIDEFNEFRTKDNYSRLRLGGVNLSGRNLKSVNLRATNLSRSRFDRADLSSADLSGADLTDVDLSYTKLTGAYLLNSKLLGADLSDADLSFTELSDAYLDTANLSRANLEGADLTNADLTNADLTNADLTNADLERANLTKARLTGAKLSGAVLYNTNLSEADLSDTELAHS
jgi:uncharacterized protein YjbI with pentapeptide repeats